MAKHTIFILLSATWYTWFTACHESLYGMQYSMQGLLFTFITMISIFILKSSLISIFFGKAIDSTFAQQNQPPHSLALTTWTAYALKYVLLSLCLIYAATSFACAHDVNGLCLTCNIFWVTSFACAHEVNGLCLIYAAKPFACAHNFNGLGLTCNTFSVTSFTKRCRFEKNGNAKKMLIC